MGGTVNAAEAAVRNAQGNERGAAAEKQQGVLGGRQVSDQRQGTDGPSLRERREAGAVSGNTAERTGLHSRQATEVSPASPGTDSATGPSPGDRTGEPPATSATAAPLGSASASIDPTDRLAQVLTPPDLEPIVLTNAQGVTLFRGLRHGMLKADGLDLALLKSLPDDQLRSLLDRMHPLLDGKRPRVRVSSIARYAERIRGTDSSRAETQVEFLQHGVRLHLAEEVASAALAMDPESSTKALNGEKVGLHLCAVSLAEPEARGALQQQMDDLNQLTCPSRRAPGALELLGLEFLEKNPDFRSHALRLRYQDGVLQTVLAKVSVRQFALSSAGESIDPFRVDGNVNHPRDELELMVGHIGGNRPGGGARLRTMVDIAWLRALERIGIPPAALARTATTAVDRFNKALPSNPDSFETVSRSTARVSPTLLEAGAQLKAIWAERDDWPPGADAHLRAAALISLVAHHLGEIPLLSSGDKNLTQRLEAEVKYLATYADSHEGHLPPFDSRVQR